jgi:hypothetical protein
MTSFVAFIISKVKERCILILQINIANGLPVDRPLGHWHELIRVLCNAQSCVNREIKLCVCDLDVHCSYKLSGLS